MSSEEKLEELKIQIRDLPVGKRVELADFIFETLKNENREDGSDDDNPIWRGVLQ
jgi:hypothetical protein